MGDEAGIVGEGLSCSCLDYNERYRNLKDIAVYGG